MRTSWSLFSSLLPNWRFFGDVSAGVRTYYRYGTDANSLSDWRPLFAPLPRRAWHLLINPQGTARLLAISDFSRLLGEAQAFAQRSEDFASTVSYLVAERHVRAAVPEGSTLFQFKLSTNRDDVLVSKIHGVAP
ncbi:MAG TPA: hypothetical protein VM901_03195 [Bdellovibrionota bacterium]|jgi:hypothetical protein|nr:hypothetical protein [Bdellovibrionota bacterium]